MQPKVSVIILVYCAEAYIERCARSLFAQTLDDIEYIFVNDATPDRSMDILYRVIDDFPQRKSSVRIINNKENQTVNDIEIKKEEPTSNVANDVDTNINQSFYEFKLVGNENIRECGGFDCKILKFGSINATANILEKNDEWFKVKVHENGKTMEGWINSSLVPDNIKSIQNKKDDLKNNTSDANQVDSTNNVKNSENKIMNFFKNIFNFFKR